MHVVVPLLQCTASTANVSAKRDTLMLGQAAPAGNIKVSRRQRRSFEMRYLQPHGVALATALGVIVTMVILGGVFLACGWPPSATTQQHTQHGFEFKVALTGVAPPHVHAAAPPVFQQGPGTLVPHRKCNHHSFGSRLTAGAPKQPSLSSPPKNKYDNFSIDYISYHRVNLLFLRQPFSFARCSSHFSSSRPPRQQCRQ